jgi:chromate transporter
VSAPALLLSMGKVGLLGFGGGPSFLPLMQQECVRQGFVDDQQFLEGLAIGNALPGPIAVKMALYVGWLDAGWLGSLAALTGLIAPSAALMGALSAIVLRHRENPWVAGALAGMKPAVVGMLFFVAVDLAPTGVAGLTGVVLAGLAFAALLAKVHPAAVMLAAAAIGAIWLRA